MPKKDKIGPEFDRFGRIMDAVIADMSRQIRKALGSEATAAQVDKAVDDAVRAAGFAVTMKAEVSESATRLMAAAMDAKTISDPLAMRKWWLNKLWPGDDLKLSAKINDISRMADIKQAIKLGFREKMSWTGTARELAKGNLQKADLAKHITRLEGAARRVMANDPAAFQEYRRALKKSMRQVERLAQNGAPTQRLKKAYENVIRKSEGASAEALDKAMDRLVRAKARYNSDRVARTEMARAYGQGVYQQAVDDSDIIGIRYDLETTHPEFDICDVHCKTNQYGLGPGGYPLKALPPYPFHPQCVLPGNKVGLYGELIGAMKSHYVGRCVEITTASGRVVTVTQNHPILTNTGWKYAQFVDGIDYLFNTSATKWVQTGVNPNNQHVDLPIEQIYDAIIKSRLVLKSCMPVAPEYFYGDGRRIDKNIDVVLLDRFLRDTIEPGPGETVKQFLLNCIDLGDMFVADSTPHKIFKAFLASTGGSVGVFGKLTTLLKRQPFVSYANGLFERPAFYPGPNKPIFQYAPANTDLVCQFLLCFTGNIAFDKVVKTRNFDYSGHVYDLHVEPYQIYTCNGVIIKNCLCQSSNIYEGEGTIKGQDKAGVATWINKRTPKEQRLLMGKKGVAAFKRNKGAWEQTVRHYDGHRTIDTLRVRKGIKAKGGK